MLFFFFRCELLLLDAGLLTGQVAEIEDAGAADLTDFIHLDALDERRLVRENPLDANAAGDLTDGESTSMRGSATDLDDGTSELLEPVLVAFTNLIGHGDSVTGLESGEIRHVRVSERLFY